MITVDFHAESKKITTHATSWINRKLECDDYITFKILSATDHFTLYLTPKQFEQIKATEITSVEDGSKKED